MKRRNGLSKYDAPLRLQYEWGYSAFLKGGKFVKLGRKWMFTEYRPNMDLHTMQAREWQRGWNDAYFGKPMAYELEEETQNVIGRRG
jgi:hypothetical protein